MSDLLCKVDWTYDDIATVLENSSIDATEENIARFIEGFDWKYFQEKAIADGFEMLSSSVRGEEE